MPSSCVQAGGWAEFQTADEMETSRKYEYDPEFVPLMCKWLCPNANSSSTIVDMGCGSGFFTKIIASCMSGKSEVIGVDPDRTLIQEAEKICKRKHISNVHFKIGNIWKIPLPSNSADLVVSHIVLSNIPRQFEAILEMKRVAKIGGKVAVIESVKGGAQYYPDKRLNELAGKFHTAFGTAIDKGWRRRLNMSSYIEDIHLKIAQLFLKARLTDIASNGYLGTFLLCDTRQSITEMRAHLQTRLKIWKKHEERNEKCALIGGMKEREFHELSKRYTEYLKDLIVHPRKIRKTPEVHIASRVIVRGCKKK
jgi:ubiquinone/menaquinone biosynthesis C-methylase UbiE